MKKKLLKTGNSQALVLTKDLLALADIQGDFVEVEARDGGLFISKPRAMSLEDAIAETHKQYGNALRNLAK